MKENILRRRLEMSLYSIYGEYLDEKSKKRFEMVKESDPYINQIIEEVLDYVIYELPLDEYVVERLRGDKHVEY